MSPVKMFPIMTGRGTKGPCPSAIPWEAIAPYEGQAKANHDQTLERLAQRGGLDPIEAFFVMTGRNWHNFKMTEELEKEACAFIDKLVHDREQLQADHDRYKTALKEIAGFPPLSSTMRMQNVADEALYGSSDPRVTNVPKGEE